MSRTHTTVLKDVAVDALKIKSNAIIVDATYGAGGHASLIVKQLSSDGTFIGIDVDENALKSNEEALQASSCTIHRVCANFRTVDTVLSSLHITHVDGILADLGWRMDQFGGNEKGFSFQVDEPLVMTFGSKEHYLFTAADIVNEWEEENIAQILSGYGGERYARGIARALVREREDAPILTTFDLVSVIQRAVPPAYRHGKIHPATRMFQALRIAVNDECGALEAFIHGAIPALAPHGRLVIITFHSLEDRIVKHLFKQYAHDGYGAVLTKKPIIATRDETLVNPRARSAKLRIFEKQ